MASATTIHTAIVLAAGRGERMWPFAEVRNKCAMPIANVPNVRRLADSLDEIGIRRLVVVVGAHEGSIRHALRDAPGEIRYVRQPDGVGTAGALLAALAGVPDDEILVLYADTVTTTANVKAVLDAYSREDVAGAALWDEVGPGEGGNWLRAEVRDGLLRAIVGHDYDATTRLCGIFAFDRSLVPYLEANPGPMRNVPVGGMPPVEADIAQSLNDWPVDIAAVRARDFVIDLDKPWHVLEANLRVTTHLLAGLTESRIHPSARVHDGAEIDGHIVLGENVEIGNRVVCRGSMIVGANTRVVNGPIVQDGAIIGRDCRISDYCLLDGPAVVGDRCVVGHGAELGGVMFDGAYLWHYCEISGVVGASVDIGAATVCGTLRFDDGLAEHRIRGRRERPAHGANATYYGDYSRTGVNVITMPGVKIGAYACVGGGIVVYEDVPSRTLRLLKQETVDRPWGPVRYGW